MNTATKDAGMTGKQTVSLKEAARTLGMDVRWVRKLIDDGTLEASRTAGGHWRIRARSLRSYQELELITAAEAARRLGVTQKTLGRWLASGKLPAARIGEQGHWQIRAAAVEALLRQRTEGEA